MGCAISSVRVPVVTKQMRHMPEIMVHMRSLKWRGTAFFADIDGTILPSVNPHEVHRPNYLCNRPLVEIVSLADQARFGFVSAADMSLQNSRVIVPMIAHLRNTKNLKVMENIALSSNRGAMISVFDKKGGLLEDICRQYHKEHGIDPEDYPILENILNRCLDRWYSLSGYDGIVGFEMRPIPQGLKPDPGNRNMIPEGYPPDFMAAQIAIRPFPRGGSVREDMISMIREETEASDISGKYEFTTGGSTTIDANRRGINKQSGISWLMKYWGIPIDTLAGLENPSCMPVFGLGDEFTIRADRHGRPALGGDMSMLEIPNLIGLAVNNDPESITKVMHFCGDSEPSRRLVYLGSGPAATTQFTIWANNPESTGTGIEMPVVTPQEAYINDDLAGFIASGRTDGIVVVSGSLLTGFRHGKEVMDPTKADPALEHILKILEKGVPVVVASGGDYNTRIVPIFDALQSALERMDGYNGKEAFLHNMLFYSNGGTVKAAVSEQGLAIDQAHSAPFLFDEASVLKISKELQSIAKEYNRRFAREHRLEYASKRAGVDVRALPSQISLTPLLMDKRGWVMERFMEASAKRRLPQTELHFGGYSMDVTKKGVNKSTIIDDCLAHFGRFGRNRILYLGGEFSFWLDHTGAILSGIDMEIFLTGSLDNIACAIALSNDQDTIPEHDKILPGGSGTGALIEWLKALSNNL